MVRVEGKHWMTSESFKELRTSASYEVMGSISWLGIWKQWRDRVIQPGNIQHFFSQKLAISSWISQLAMVIDKGNIHILVLPKIHLFLWQVLKSCPILIFTPTSEQWPTSFLMSYHSQNFTSIYREYIHMSIILCYILHHIWYIRVHYGRLWHITVHIYIYTHDYICIYLYTWLYIYIYTIIRIYIYIYRH